MENRQHFGRRGSISELKEWYILYVILAPGIKRQNQGGSRGRGYDGEGEDGSESSAVKRMRRVLKRGQLVK